MVSLDAAQDSVNRTLAAVIESIIGSQVTQDESAVDNAISALSKGQIGQSSAAATNNEVDMPKVNVDKFDSRGFQIDGIESIPLPEVPTLNFQMCL